MSRKWLSLFSPGPRRGVTALQVFQFDSTFSSPVCFNGCDVIDASSLFPVVLRASWGI